MSERTWKRICYTILAVLVPILVGFVLAIVLGVDSPLTGVLIYGGMVVWLVLIWRPRRAS